MIWWDINTLENLELLEEVSLESFAEDFLDELPCAKTKALSGLGSWAEFEHHEVCKESWKEQGPYDKIDSKEKGIDKQTWGCDPPPNQIGSWGPFERDQTCLCFGAT